MKTSIKALGLVSLLSVSTAAHADNSSLIGIIFKIYQAASTVNSLREVQEDKRVESARANGFVVTEKVVEAPRIANDAPETLPVPEFNPCTTEEGCAYIAAQKAKVEEFGKAQAAYRNSDQAKRVQAEAARVAEENSHRVAMTMSEIRVEREENDKLYLEDFNNRKLSEAQFKKLYYNRAFGTAFVRNNVTLVTVTDKEKIVLEKHLQAQDANASRSKAYHVAFKKSVYKVIELMGLSFEELQKLNRENAYQDKEFNLNPASSALHIKAYRSGVLAYEYEHQELGTHCTWGIGGQDKYIVDCDKLLGLEMKEYKIGHKNVNLKLTKQDIQEIANEIDAHQNMD